MAKYRKKPVIIDAIQLSEGKTIPEWREIEALNPVLINAIGNNVNGQFECICVSIATLEGVMIALPGDWIIKGTKGEYYPCKPNIFEATYEPVEADNAP